MSRWEGLGLAAVLLIAALVRLPGLESRGQFDADQGHDMLTLVSFTREGVVPLLGPRTSVGEFHHGAFYYFLLAPAAAISGADPVAVTAFIALLGILAVALTWWLARSIGGALAGLAAGAILAVSPGAIETSTFIWNPNPIPFFAALALAAGWHGHVTQNVGWWALAIGAAGAVAQLHVLGLVFLFGLLALNLVELRTNRGAWRGLLGGLVIVAVLYLPLAIHELTTGFTETRLILEYLGSEGSPGGDPLFSVIFTLLRIVGWPIVGLVTDVPIGAGLVLIAFLGLVGWYELVTRGPARTALRWLVGLLAFNTIALALVAPGLQRVVPGLPNDHYHAFLDPVVAILFGLALAGLLERGVGAWRDRAAGGERPMPRFVAGALGLAAVVALLGVEVARIPPPDRNGGWAAAQAAGERIVDALRGPPAALVSLPAFKSGDGIEFPIRRAVDRRPPESISTTTGVVVVCDRLLEAQIGAACGGPAEDRFMLGEGAAVPDPNTGITPSTSTLVDRFDASPRTSISVYRPVVTP